MSVKIFVTLSEILFEFYAINHQVFTFNVSSCVKEIVNKIEFENNWVLKKLSNFAKPNYGSNKNASD